MFLTFKLQNPYFPQTTYMQIIQYPTYSALNKMFFYMGVISSMLSFSIGYLSRHHGTRFTVQLMYMFYFVARSFDPTIIGLLRSSLHRTDWRKWKHIHKKNGLHTCSKQAIFWQRICSSAIQPSAWVSEIGLGHSSP